MIALTSSTLSTPLAKTALPSLREFTVRDPALKSSPSCRTLLKPDPSPLKKEAETVMALTSSTLSTPLDKTAFPSLMVLTVK